MNPKLQLMLMASGAMTTSIGAPANDCPKPGRKRAVNISIDEALLVEARQLGINLSQTLDTVLRDMVKQTRIKEWSTANQKAVASYNKYISGGGT